MSAAAHPARETPRTALAPAPASGVDFELIANAIPHMVWMADRDGSTEYFSRWGTAYTGLPEETNHGWGWLSLIHPDDVERAHVEWEQASGAKAEFRTEWRVRRADGEYRWLAIHGVPVRDGDGRLQKWVGTCTDVEETKRLTAELRRSQEEAVATLGLLEAAEATAPVGAAFIDREFRVVRINATLAAVNGGTVEQHLGRPVAELVPGMWRELEQAFQLVLESGEPLVGVELVGPSAAADGAPRHWLNSFHPVRLEGKIVGIGVVAFDITARKQAEDFRSAVMAHMAEGVYVLDSEGRLTFMNSAASKMLGWSEDELRGKSMHEIVHFQHSDGRAYAADECTLLKVRTEGEPARISDQAFTRKDGTVFPVEYSAAPLLDGSNGNGIHGVVVVFRDITEQAEERARVQRELAALSWVGRIRDALDEDRLTLYTQPIIPLEAIDEPREELLVRMLGRDGEVVPPGSFLPIAEKYGLIGEIDRWVVTQAIQLAAGGRRVQANLSADSIGRSDLLSLIENQLQASRANPANLVFEITETALMNDIDAGEEFARDLVSLGCSLALDDFGTGFGSFTYLKRLPVTYLKIDQDFVHELATNQSNQHLVRAIVGLAHGFGYQTIAEGVEDQATLHLLREYGVDYAQGFHLGGPQALA